jgi:hypothetical protein
MPKSNAPYLPEFRQQMIELVTLVATRRSSPKSLVARRSLSATGWHKPRSTAASR